MCFVPACYPGWGRLVAMPLWSDTFIGLAFGALVSERATLKLTSSECSLWSILL